MRDDRKIKFRMVSAQHFINEALDLCIITIGFMLLIVANLFDMVICMAELQQNPTGFFTLPE